MRIQKLMCGNITRLTKNKNKALILHYSIDDCARNITDSYYFYL